MASLKIDIRMGPALGAMRDLARRAARSKKISALCHANFEKLGIEIVQCGGVLVGIPNEYMRQILQKSRRKGRSSQGLRSAESANA